jgi:hypothetical protein
MSSNCYQVIVVKCHSVFHQIISTFQWCRLYSGSVCHQIISTFQSLNMHWQGYNEAWRVTKKATNVKQNLQWLSVSSNHIDFLAIQPFQCLSVSSNHLHYVVIKYAFPLCLSSTTHCRMSLYKDMPLQTGLTHHLFIYMLPTHYPLEHASLPDPGMEWASILLLCSMSEAYHLFGANHVWQEMLGVSWHWPKWLRMCAFLYLNFINWWLQLQYCY